MCVCVCVDYVWNHLLISWSWAIKQMIP